MAATTPMQGERTLVPGLAGRGAAAGAGRGDREVTAHAS
jgi:hypothetical protein